MTFELRNINGSGSIQLQRVASTGSFSLINGSYVPPPPSPTATPTPTPAVTATATPTPLPTSTPTATPSPTATPTPVPTSTPTPLPTPTPTPTAAPTATPTPLPTATPTPLPTSTPTPAPTPTPTPTPAPTSTPTPTPTPTPVPPTPSDPTLQIWYDGADSTQYSPTNPSNGQAITQWTDKSATAHNAAPTGGPGTRPLYTASIQNGKSALYFDSVEDGLEAPLTSLQAITGSTMIWVAKTLNASINQQMVEGVVKSGGSYTATNGYKIFVSASHGYQVAMASGSAIANVIPDTNWHIHTLVFDGTQTGNASRLKYRIDGLERTLTFQTNVSSSTSPNINGILIGTDASLNNDFNGYAGELLLYTKTLSTSEISNTEAYLFNKWNITQATASGLYDFTAFTFTNASATGRTGPTYTQMLTAYTGSASASGWVTNTSYFTSSIQGIQLWTVPQTATYRITAAGAAGGSSPTLNFTGGFGATVTSDINLSQCQQLAIVVGQMGGNRFTGSGAATFNGGSGGGGTFVYDNTTVTYYMAIGGGGGAGGAAANLCTNQATASGKFNTINGSTVVMGSGFFASGGFSGSGGCISTRNILYGGPGAGINNSGSNANGGQGLSRLGNWLGGTTGSIGNINGIVGGFGGGGAAVDGDGSGDGNVIAWAGGGGGYSGGGPGGNSGQANSQFGGGGGSYYTGSLITGSSNSNQGHGYVTITKL